MAIDKKNVQEIIHEGHNVKRIREILQVKQITLANLLGKEWNQKKISELEDKEKIEPSLLEKIAEALNVSTEAIRNFNEERAINIISTFNTNDNAVASVGNTTPTYNFNPIEKLVESYENNKVLYERLLQAEKEKNELLTKLADGKK